MGAATARWLSGRGHGPTCLQNKGRPGALRVGVALGEVSTNSSTVLNSEGEATVRQEPRGDGGRDHELQSPQVHLPRGGLAYHDHQQVRAQDPPANGQQDHHQ